MHVPGHLQLSSLIAYTSVSQMRTSSGIHLRSLTLCCRHSNEFSAHTWAWPREGERVAPGHCIEGNTAATCVPDPSDLPPCLLASSVGFLIEPRACVLPENPRRNFALECLNEGWWSKKVHKKGAECKFISRLHAMWQGQKAMICFCLDKL